MSDTTLHRRFSAEADGETFVITEFTPAPGNPISWCPWDFPGEGRYSHQDAWHVARQQHRPVIVRLLDGTTKKLGVVFNPHHFERAAYSGYVSAGFAMTDGFFAPEDFDQWAHFFRQHPVLDEPEQQHLAPSLAAYRATLAN